MIQVCSNFHPARVFVVSTRPDDSRALHLGLEEGEELVEERLVREETVVHRRQVRAQHLPRPGQRKPPVGRAQHLLMSGRREPHDTV